MQNILNEVLILYAIQPTEDMQIEAHINVQAYSMTQSYTDEYDSITMMVHESLRDEITMYQLLRETLMLEDLRISELDRLIIQVKNNGYVYAAGIWQVDWSNPQKRYIFQPICSTNIDLVETVDLLSDEADDITLAIQQGATFLKERFTTSILVSWQEIDPLRMSPDNSWEERNWEMTWKCFEAETLRVCHLVVSYHPHSTEAQVSVKLVKEEEIN